MDTVPGTRFEHDQENGKTSKCSSPRLIIKNIGDFLICLLIFGLDRLLLEVWTTTHRGFFCDDQSLMYSLKTNTVSNTVLYVCAYIVPVVVIVCVESIRYWQERRFAAYNRKPRKHRVHPLYFYVWKYYVTALFINVAILLLTDVAKLSVGRLRPHFFDACKPDWKSINCSVGYVTEYNCTNTDKDVLNNMRLSFFSGHASSSMAPAVFLVLYLQYRMRWRATHIVRALLQLLFVAGASYVGYSRIEDHKHHPLDVLAGMLVGAVVAVLSGFGIASFSKEDQCKPSVL